MTRSFHGLKKRKSSSKGESSHCSKKRKSHSKEESFPNLRLTNVIGISKSEGVSVYEANLGKLDVCIRKIHRSNINKRRLEYEEVLYEEMNKIHNEFICCSIDKVEDAENRIYFISERYKPATEYLHLKKLMRDGKMTLEFEQLLVDWLRGFNHILKSGRCHGNIKLSSLLVTREARGKVGNLSARHISATYCNDDYRSIATTIRELFEQNCEELPKVLDLVLKYIENSSFPTILNEIDEHPMFVDPNGQLLYMANAYWKCDKQHHIGLKFIGALDRVLQVFPMEDNWMKKAYERLQKTLIFDPTKNAQGPQGEPGSENDKITQNSQENSAIPEDSPKTPLYTNDKLSFFKFYRNAVQHNNKASNPKSLKEELHEIWPYFADGLHFALIESGVRIRMKRLK